MSGRRMWVTEMRPRTERAAGTRGGLRDGLSRNPEGRPSDGWSSGSEQRLYELFPLDIAFCSFKWWNSSSQILTN